MSEVKLTVGMSCILVEDGINSYRRRSREGLPPLIIDGVITKVGRKYFTVTRGDYNHDIEFHLDNHKQRTEYDCDYSFWLGKDEYVHAYELKQKRSRLGMWFSSSYNSNIDKLQEEDLDVMMGIIAKYEVK